MCYLTCGYRRQRPESGHSRCRCGLHLHGEPTPPGQVRATWRSVSRQDIPDPAPDRGLTAAVFEQVNRLFDDFARALRVSRSRRRSPRQSQQLSGRRSGSVAIHFLGQRHSRPCESDSPRSRGLSRDEKRPPRLTARRPSNNAPRDRNSLLLHCRQGIDVSRLDSRNTPASSADRCQYHLQTPARWSRLCRGRPSAAGLSDCRIKRAGCTARNKHIPVALGPTTEFSCSQ
jgi:hypothetical protein